MDACGWPAIPFDGELLMLHQDALLKGGKVQAAPGFADHVTFEDPSLCADCEKHRTGQNAVGGNRVEQHGGCTGECNVQNARDDTAAGHIAEMTECHGDRLCNFTDDIHGRHRHNRFRKALEPADKTVVFDAVVPDDHRDRERPDHHARQVSR